MKFKIVIMLTILWCPSVFSCSGKVDRVQLTRVGEVQLISSEIYDDGSAGRTVCNVSLARQGVTPETCRGWYSLVLASIAQDKAIKLQYDAGVSCTGMATWSSAPAPWMISNS